GKFGKKRILSRKSVELMTTNHIADIPFWSSIGYVHDVFVRGDTAYLNAGQNGLFIVDFRNINAPQMIGSLDFYPQQGYNHSGWLMSDKPYYALADETHGMDVKILDVGDMGDIEVTDTIGSDEHEFSIPHNLIYKGDYLFVSYYFDGMFIYDCSDPEHPELTGFYDTSTEQHQDGVYRGCWGVYPFLPSGRILASDMQTGLWVFGTEFPLGTEELDTDKSTLTIYPNPASDRITFRGFKSKSVYRILDMTGKQVQAGSNTVPGIDVRRLESGIYSLLVETADSSVASRFIKL
ncbi:MAG: T9SS type A sorting domain-containing protein, partial [Flavobacteriales bacterium]|nr:T9SS type A sorting domain-containing protein [Flavobacteriales bacterium]